ncbi:MAG: hypothetical protein NTW20_16345, partial [Rhodobacterales bacterium]|nr:hypothetical protein [Rhodobacterales bacterium]
MILDRVNLNGVTVRLTLAEGRIAAIDPTSGPATQTVLPLLVEAHVHLDKAFTIARCRPDEPGLFGAINAMVRDKGNWTANDLRHRIGQGMNEAYA